MDTSQVYHNYEWSMYNSYQDDVATPYLSTWSPESPNSPTADSATYHQHYHLPSLSEPLVDETHIGQSSNHYFQTSRAAIPFQQFSDYQYLPPAPPTPLLDFSPSPVTGNTPDWAFPSLDDGRAVYYDGPALSRSTAVVAPLPFDVTSDYRNIVEIMPSSCEVAAEEYLVGSHKRAAASQSYPSPSSPRRQAVPYSIPSPSIRLRKWSPEEEDDGEVGEDGDSEYKPKPKLAPTKRPRSSSGSTSRTRLSTTAHGCRPQTTLDTSCLLSTKMVRAPAKDDADDIYKPFVCHYGHDGPSGPCNKGFHKKNEWKRHLRTIHAWDEALQIQRGELAFAEARLVTDEDGLAEMVAEITRCFCSGCGKLFARPEILTRHWNNVEKAEKRKALKAAKEQAAARAKARATSTKRTSSR